MKTKKKLIAGIVVWSLMGIMSAVNAEEKKTVAVFDFKVDSMKLLLGEGFSFLGRDQMESDLLTSDLINGLVKDGNYDVIDREVLKKLDYERRWDGLWSERGKEVGADYVIYGEVELIEAAERSMDFKSSGICVEEMFGRYIVSMRVVEVKSGRVIAAEKVNHTELERINEYNEMSALTFMNKLKEDTVRKLVNRITEVTTPIKVASVSCFYAYLNRGEGSRLKVGTRLKVFRLGDAIEDPDSGEGIGVAEYAIGELKVTKVLSKVTVAQVSRYAVPIEKGDICYVIEEREDDEPVDWESGEERLYGR